MKKELIKSIREKEIQLAKLKEHVDKSTICSELYNKVVLEKAILVKKLEDLNNNSLLEGIKILFLTRELLYVIILENN